MLWIVLSEVAEIEYEYAVDAGSNHLGGIVMEFDEGDEADCGHVQGAHQGIHLIQEEHAEV